MTLWTWAVGMVGKFSTSLPGICLRMECLPLNEWCRNSAAGLESTCFQGGACYDIFFHCFWGLAWNPKPMVSWVLSKKVICSSWAWWKKRYTLFRKREIKGGSSIKSPLRNDTEGILIWFLCLCQGFPLHALSQSKLKGHRLWCVHLQIGKAIQLSWFSLIKPSHLLSSHLIFKIRCIWRSIASSLKNSIPQRWRVLAICCPAL